MEKRLMYNSRYVMSVLRGDQVLPETNGRVRLEWGDLYRIRLRNRNDHDAVVAIDIDGEVVTDGGLVVPARSRIDLDRRVDANERFRFVRPEHPESTTEGKDRRPETGRLRAVFYRAERPVEAVRYLPGRTGGRIAPYVPWPPMWPDRVLGDPSDFGVHRGLAESNELYAMCSVGTHKDVSGWAPDAPTGRVGATVDGGLSDQKFYTSDVRPVGPGTELTLWLLGPENRPKSDLSAEIRELKRRIAELERG